MGTTTNPLHIRRTSDGTEWKCKCFTTSSEAMSSLVGSYFWTIKNNGTTCYVPLLATSNGSTQYRTPLKVKIWSTEYYVQTDKLVGTAKFTSSGTWTCPLGVTKVKATVVAGGGGGVHVWNNNEGAQSASDGGKSSFSSITCTGGGGAKAYNYYDTVYDESGNEIGTSYASTSCSGGSAGSPNGTAGDMNSWDNSSVANTAGYTIKSISGTTIGTYGTGGGAGGPNNTSSRWDRQAAGGSGGYSVSILSVTPGATYTVTVGKGGAGRENTGESNSYAYSGTGGCVFLEWGNLSEQ